MSRPTHLLKHEHRVIEKVMRALDGMCWRLKNDEPVPSDALFQMLDFIQNFTDGTHHAKEEQILFPLLERSGIESDENGPLGFLRREHATERGLAQQLQQTMAEFQAGDQQARNRFAATAWQFRQHLVNHIEQEDAILFCLTEELLDDFDKDDLAYSLAQANGQHGKQSTQHYERVAQELETAWAI